MCVIIGADELGRKELLAIADGYLPCGARPAGWHVIHTLTPCPAPAGHLLSWATMTNKGNMPSQISADGGNRMSRPAWGQVHDG